MMALATAVGAIVEMSQIATGTYHFTSGTAWLGAAGGPLAFLAGERLGAVALLPPVTHGLLRLSISWAIAFAIFSAVVRRLTPERNAPPFSSTR